MEDDADQPVPMLSPQVAADAPAAPAKPARAKRTAAMKTRVVTPDGVPPAASSTVTFTYGGVGPDTTPVPFVSAFSINPQVLEHAPQAAHQVAAPRVYARWRATADAQVPRGASNFLVFKGQEFSEQNCDVAYMLRLGVLLERIPE